jgi:flagellar hook assembly protein FlgD
MPLAGRVKIAVYDLNGRLIRILADEARTAGSYSVLWDGTDAEGNAVASGIYVCRMEVRTGEAKRFVRSIKMGLVR